MSEISEKVSYLKGLADGLDIDKSSKEGKLLLAIIDTLGDIADNVQDLEDIQDQMGEEVDEIHGTIDDLLEEVFSDGEDDDNEEEDGDFGFFDLTCPHCNEKVYIDEDMLDGDDNDSVVCPNCNEEIEIEISCGCGGCGHDHGHDDEEDDK